MNWSVSSDSVHGEDKLPLLRSLCEMKHDPEFILRKKKNLIQGYENFSFSVVREIVESKRS